jgi:hypothetical protein
VNFCISLFNVNPAADGTLQGFGRVKDRIIPPWTVQNYMTSQFEMARQVLNQSFSDDSSFTYMFPQIERRNRRLPWLFGMILLYGSKYGEVYTTGEESPALWCLKVMCPKRVPMSGA